MRARRITGQQREALHGSQATRRIEVVAASALPEHCLMARAGLSVARLARALQPHARCIWVACGPGNNGGDGLIAAIHLQQWAQDSGSNCRVWVTHWTGDTPDESRLPGDASHALAQAREAGVSIERHPPEHWDLAIDAMFGIGLARPPQGVLAQWIALLNTSRATALCVDVPSGLDADTGQMLVERLSGNPTLGLRHTLSLLTLKPGLFTADGRDASGTVWFDDLQADSSSGVEASAWLAGRDDQGRAVQPRPHSSHKGSFGDVLVIGGQDIAVSGSGMTGAAVLAARSALNAGAGRVFVGLLGEPESGNETRWDPTTPELMFRRVSKLLDGPLLNSSTVVCGCGGGSLVADVLATVLTSAPRLVLDADALNAVALDSSLKKHLRHRATIGLFTVLTPHPLEAARLLGCPTTTVMSDRLAATSNIVEQYGAMCVLKGSGTVIGNPGQTPWINPTGNARLATAGTGDVLAGLIGSAISGPAGDAQEMLDRVARAVYQHGHLADQYAERSDVLGLQSPPALTASRLADLVQTLD